MRSRSARVTRTNTGSDIGCSAGGFDASCFGSVVFAIPSSSFMFTERTMRPRGDTSGLGLLLMMYATCWFSTLIGVMQRDNSPPHT